MTTPFPASMSRAPTVRTWTILAAALLAMVAAIALRHPDVEGARMAVRATARTSFALFLATFLASTAARAWPGAWTRAWLARRRALGLGFATSHAWHAAALAAFAWLAPDDFAAAVRPAQWVAGGTAYLVIALMAATSNDASQRGLGARAWRRLHTAGSWFLWASFMASFGRRVPLSAAYAAPVAMLLAAAAWRLASRHGAGRRARPPVPADTAGAQRAR